MQEIGIATFLKKIKIKKENTEETGIMQWLKDAKGLFKLWNSVNISANSVNSSVNSLNSSVNSINRVKWKCKYQ